MLIRCTSLHQRWHLCGWVGSNRSLEMFHAVGMCIWLPKFNEMQRNIPCSNFRQCNACPVQRTETYQGQQEVAHLVLPSWRGARNWRSSRARSLGSAKLLLHAEWKMVPWNAQNTSAPISFDLCYQWICAKLNKLRISNSFWKVAEGCWRVKRASAEVHGSTLQKHAHGLWHDILRWLSSIQCSTV